MGMVMGRTALKSFYIMQILLERTDEDHSLKDWKKCWRQSSTWGKSWILVNIRLSLYQEEKEFEEKLLLYSGQYFSQVEETGAMKIIGIFFH